MVYSGLESARDGSRIAPCLVRRSWSSEGEINLAEAALLIASEEYPDLDVPR
jgi:hypothetical protein